MRYKFLAVSLAIILFACSSRNKVPSGILPPGKMEDVMWDMLQAGEFINGFILFRDTLGIVNEESRKWYEKVCQIHGVTDQQFRDSYSWYRQHPLLMRPLLDSLSGKPEPPKRPADSAKKSGVDTATVTRGPVPGPNANTARRLDSLRRLRLENRRPILDTTVH